MDMQSRIQPTPHLASKSKILIQKEEEFTSLAKAIFDEVNERTEKKSLEATEGIKSELTMLVGRLIGEEIGKWSEMWKSQMQEKFSELQNGMQEKLLSFISALPPVNVVFPDSSILVQIPQMKAPDVIVNVPQQQIDFHVPEQPINFHVPQMKAPDVIVNVPQQEVNVHVPEQKSIVNVQVPEMKAPDVIVNVPEQKSIVNVQVPEQKAPDVVVNVPKQEKQDVNVTLVTPPRRKIFQYGQYGEPVATIEEDIKEKEE